MSYNLQYIVDATPKPLIGIPSVIDCPTDRTSTGTKLSPTGGVVVRAPSEADEPSATSYDQININTTSTNNINTRTVCI